MRAGKSDTFICRFSHVTAESTPKGKAASFFKQQVEKNSEGRIRVEVYPNSELYGDKDEMQAIQSNSIQMLAPASAKFTTVAPAIQVLDLPFIFESLHEVPKLVAPKTELGRAIFANRDLERRGMKVLGLWDAGMKQVHSNNRTLRPADMRGRKYRIQPSDIIRTQYEKWGGVPTPMAFSEVYSALQQGVIDGGENTYGNIESQKMHTVQKFVNELNHGYIGYVHVVNREWWNLLPEDLQRVVQKAADDAAAYNRKEAVKVDKRSKELIAAHSGTEIVVPSQAEIAEFRRLVLPSVYLQYRDVIGADLVDEILRLRGER